VFILYDCQCQHAEAKPEIVGLLWGKVLLYSRGKCEFVPWRVGVAYKTKEVVKIILLVTASLLAAPTPA